LLRDPNGRVVGQIDADLWLRKRVRLAYQLRSPKAWALDANHLTRLRALGGRGVELRDDQGTTWTASLAAFDQYGFPVERGYGQQVGLKLERWSRSDDHEAPSAIPNMSPPPRPEPPATPPLQLGLALDGAAR
jgi:hypothetical protein